MTGQVEQGTYFFRSVGLSRPERVAVYMDKRIVTVVAMFAAAKAGSVFMPVKHLLKAKCNAQGALS